MRRLRRAAVAVVATGLVAATALAGAQDLAGERATSHPASHPAARTPVVVAPVAPVPLRRVHAGRQIVDDSHRDVGGCLYRGVAGRALPDPLCTPGAVDPALTVSVICAKGWSTDSVRPSTRLTDLFRGRSMGEYGANDAAGGGEYDHLVPLELGGANATSNLWFEPGPRPNAKDKVENRLHDDVCAGRISLAAAQSAIAADWTQFAIDPGGRRLAR